MKLTSAEEPHPRFGDAAETTISQVRMPAPHAQRNPDQSSGCARKMEMEWRKMIRRHQDVHA